jgi:hypothetical protein
LGHQPTEDELNAYFITRKEAFLGSASLPQHLQQMQAYLREVRKLDFQQDPDYPQLKLILTDFSTKLAEKL